MTNLSIDFKNARWSDSLERTVMNQTLNNSGAVSMKELSKTIFNGVKKVASAIGRKLVFWAEIVYEARQQQARLTASYYY